MWIKQNIEAENGGLPRFVKKFNISGKVSRCELEITATGVFVAKINDFEIPDRFMPGYTNYKKYIDVVRYNLTKYISDENIIEVTVANGWYKGKLGYGNGTNIFGDEKRLYAIITIVYENGEVQKIETDESWETGMSEVISADFFDGEVIDARRGKDCKMLPHKAVISDFSVPLEEYSYESVKVAEVIEPKVIYNDGKVMRYDCGKNFAGVIAFIAQGNEGDKVFIRYAEVLSDDGLLYTANLRSAKCTDEFILSGEEDFFNPKFTYHGFRFAEIIKPENVKIDGVKGFLLTQDIEYYGSFECSDELINGVYEIVKNGQRSNFISIPTDCPQRDERLGWTGDAQIFCNSAMFNANCKRFFENYMKLVRTDMLPNGKIPSFVPFYVPVAPNTAGVPGWADCVAVMPYHHYLHYRDKKIIRDNIDACEKWIGYYLSKSENYTVKIVNNFGDWLSVDDKTDKDIINQCFFGYSLSLVSKMMSILGEKEKSAKYADMFVKSKDAFCKKYYKNGKLTSDTQTAYALAYSVGFLSGKEIKSRLPELVRNNGNSLTTGFVGSRFILSALCDIGEKDLAYELIGRKEYPSWGYMLNNGATTVWERWNGYTRESGFEDPEMNSFNHYSLGVCIEWLYTYVLGIKLSANTDKVEISPTFSDKILFARGRTKIADGRIFVFWKHENAAVTLEVSADEKVKYEIVLRDAEAVSYEKIGNKTTMVVKLLR